MSHLKELHEQSEIELKKKTLNFVAHIVKYQNYSGRVR